jgi:hypothetical protein
VRDFDPLYVSSGPTTAVSTRPALGLLHFNHPTFVVRVGTSRSVRTMFGLRSFVALPKQL